MTTTPRRSRRAAPSAPALPPLPEDFAVRVIAWQRRHGRHHLPWQNTGDAYRVWLSEIMLQQTQVSAVLGYYARFVERFPTVQALAAAPADDVMAAWAGLGYYTRARNLHRCAQIVVAEHGGAFPRDPEALAALPGIGRSTAAAIAAFSYGVRAAILDGNVKRVFARLRHRRLSRRQARRGNDVAHRRDRAAPGGRHPVVHAGPDGPGRHGLHARQAGMPDRRARMSARIAVRGAPDRARDGTARAASAQGHPERAATLLMALHDGAVLLQRRPQRGIWGGLWSLPLVGDMDTALDAHPVATDVAHAAAQAYGTVSSIESAGVLMHTFTHFRLQMHLLRADIRQPAALGDDWRWCRSRGSIPWECRRP